MSLARYFFLVFIMVANVSHGEDGIDDSTLLERFKVEPEPVCKRVSAKEPPEPDTPWFSERHYLTIDGSKNCQILDVWLETLTKAPDDYRRDKWSVLYRFHKGRWIKEVGLDYLPKIRIRDTKTNIVYLVIDFDGEFPFSVHETVYFSGSWGNSGQDYGGLGIKSLNGCAGISEPECRFLKTSLERVEKLKEKIEDGK